MIYFVIAFILVLISFLLHTICHYQEHHQYKSLFKHKTVSVIIDLGFIAWGAMIYFDPIKGGLPLAIILPVGLTLALIGGILVYLSTKAKHGFEKTDQLITTGVYKKIRHPMYLGMVLTFVGFPLAFQCWLTLASVVIWLSMILLWRNWEQQELIKRFGQEYSDYIKKTWF